MDCPACGLTNPPSARRCDCGHYLDGTATATPAARPARWRRFLPPAWYILLVAVCCAWLGYAPASPAFLSITIGSIVIGPLYPAVFVGVLAVMSARTELARPLLRLLGPVMHYFEAAPISHLLVPLVVGGLSLAVVLPRLAGDTGRGLSPVRQLGRFVREYLRLMPATTAAAVLGLGTGHLGYRLADGPSHANPVMSGRTATSGPAADSAATADGGPLDAEPR